MAYCFKRCSNGSIYSRQIIIGLIYYFDDDNHMADNLRYYGLASLTGLTVVGWFLDKIPPEVTTAVFAAVGVLITADYIKHRTDAPAK